MKSRDKSHPKTAPPQNWPAHIPYLTRPIYSAHLTPAHLSALRTRPSDPSDPLPEIPRDLKPGPCPAVRITPITDPNRKYLHSTHPPQTEKKKRKKNGLEQRQHRIKPNRTEPPADPAHGQAGLFATRDLRPGELILPYLGEVHVGTHPFGQRPADGAELAYDYGQSDYDLWLDREADLAVDAARAGNEARFINDYRGVPGTAAAADRQHRSKPQQKQQRQRPNAEFRVAWDPRIGERCMAVYVLPAGKRAVGRARTVGIARGEEVLVSYGRGFWQGRRGQEDGVEEGDGGWQREGDGGGS